MKFSELFTKTLRQAPSEETAKNAKFLARAGFVYKNSAGIYSFLPLGWRVIQKIAAIIREEMNAIGGQEMFMPALVEKRYLQATGRWDAPIGFKVVSEIKGGQKSKLAPPFVADFVLGWTHEEVLTEIASKYISSYQDLPFYAYQIQTKFRNEPRPKSGLLRSKEFTMKDLYSFHTNEEDLFRYYDIVAKAYQKIFQRCGLQAVYTLAGGGNFTIANTHEFQVISDVGEDTILICPKCGYAENKEISKLKSGQKCPKCSGKIEQKQAIEVANIFPLGNKYSKAFNLQYADRDGSKRDVIMGSYGIGLGRLMAAVVEIYSDDKGIIWPKAVAPFKIHLLTLLTAEAETNLNIKKTAENLYKKAIEKGLEIIYDDREKSAGEKLADADLIGIPWRLLLSEKTLKTNSVELKQRNQETPKLLPIAKILDLLK